MKTRKSLKNNYIYSTLAILTVIFIFFAVYLNWNVRWYYFIFIFIFAYKLGDFLSLYFAGVNVSSLVFLGDYDITHQDFIIEFQFGFSPMFSLHGYFDNSLGLKEADLSLMIYNNVTKQMLLPTIKSGVLQTVILPYRKENIYVNFE